MLWLSCWNIWVRNAFLHRNQQLHSFAIKSGESLRRRLKRTASRLKTSSEDVTASQTTPGDTMLSELRLQHELTEPVRLTKSNLHPYRLQVKDLRWRAADGEGPSGSRAD